MVVYHHKDADGYAAAAVVALFRNQHLVDPKETRPAEADGNILFCGLQYGDPVPWALPAKGDLVYIVDFHLEPEDMRKIMDRVGVDNVVWIDHHKTHLHTDYGVNVRGLRVDGKSGCRLTWEWFYGNTSLPAALELIDDYDVWRHRYPGSRAFIYGLETMAIEPRRDIWTDLLDSRVVGQSGRITVDYVINRGYVAQDYRRVQSELMCQSYGFDAGLDDYRVFVLSAGMKGSDTFGPRLANYDIVATQIFTGDKWVVSLYTADKNIDVGVICSRFKGGGHAGAAGFVLPGSMPPFSKGVTLKSIKTKQEVEYVIDKDKDKEVRCT